MLVVISDSVCVQKDPIQTLHPRLTTCHNYFQVQTINSVQRVIMAAILNLCKSDRHSISIIFSKRFILAREPQC